MNKPLLRMLYRNYKGEVFVILGFAEDEVSKEEVVIFSNVSDGKSYIRTLKTFFEKSPKTGKVRFELVTPK